MQPTRFFASSDKATQIIWLSDAALPVSIKITNNQGIQHWQLQSLDFEPEKNKLLFQKLMNYQLTDFADIGDNESDPFLSKMIELGFIQHGANGFYEVDNNGKRVIQSKSDHEDHPLH